MKNLVVVIAICFAASAAVAEEKVVRRGATIPADAPAVALESVLADPAAYAKKPVVIEAVVDAACTNKGCWMQLAPAAGEPGIRVTFKDYAFFVPRDSKGMRARAAGVTKVRTISRKEADHLEAEGATLTRNADGTAREVSFVATGVELRGRAD